MLVSSAYFTGFDQRLTIATPPAMTMARAEPGMLEPAAPSKGAVVDVAVGTGPVLETPVPLG
jgi:hypothetical protein